MPSSTGPAPREATLEPPDERSVEVRPFFALTGAGGFFFVSAWLLMIFAGILHDEVGINPFGYGTAMVATIGLWLVLAPAAGAIASSMRRRW
jgi:hypothetical protein